MKNVPKPKRPSIIGGKSFFKNTPTGNPSTGGRKLKSHFVLHKKRRVCLFLCFLFYLLCAKVFPEHAFALPEGGRGGF